MNKILRIIFAVAITFSILSIGNGNKCIANPNVFSVIVPTSLPINVDGNNIVATANEAKIINNSYGTIKVTGAQINAINEWSLSDYNTDFKSTKVGIKQFGFQLQGSNVPIDGTCSLDAFSNIQSNSSIGIAYNAVIAVQPDGLNQEIGNIVFTISWDTSYNNVVVNITDYYNFIDDTANIGGYKVELNASFKTALEANSGAGDEYLDWSPGNPLPNPGSIYNGTPVTSMESLFKGCIASVLDLTGFCTANVVNMKEMFAQCQALTIDLSTVYINGVTDNTDMFTECTSTVGYAHDQSDIDILNNIVNKPETLLFLIK